MKTQFVTVEIAKALTSIGFDEYCLAGYYDDSLRYPATVDKNNTSRARVFKTNKYCTKAPTWSQIIDWFRNEKKLEINVFKWGVHCYHKEDNPSGECEVLALPHYIYDIERAFEYTDDWEYQSIEDELKFHTYEEARISAILKAIEIVKNTK